MNPMLRLSEMAIQTICDRRSKDGWRAIRTFNTATGEWRLTALGNRWFTDHDGLPEYVIRILAIFDVCRSGRPNAQYE